MAALLTACFATSSVVLLGAALAAGNRDRLFKRIGEAETSRTERRPGSPIPRTAAVAVVGGLGAIAGAFVAGVPGFFGGLVAAVLPVVVERRRAARNARRLEEQLIDAVAAVAAALRSGRSLVQALRVAADEVDEPLGAVLADAVDGASLGVPFDDVLDGLALRIGGSDVRLVTGILRLHRRTGGALAGSLDDVARTLRARRDGAAELRSLTAQARLSAAILGLLPLGFFLFLSAVARRDVEAAYHTTAGASAIGLGLAMQAAAFVWIRHLLRVEA
jgi:tight adherence protein B